MLSAISVAVVLVAGSFGLLAVEVAGAAGFFPEMAARSSVRVVVAPAAGSFSFPAEVVVAAVGSAREVALR